MIYRGTDVETLAQKIKKKETLKRGGKKETQSDYHSQFLHPTTRGQNKKHVESF